MRRALLLASLLGAPALAAALGAGTVLFANGRDFPMYVNATECAGGRTVLVYWSPLFVGGYSAKPVGGEYALYASNQDPRARTGADADTCFTTTDVGAQNPGLVAGAVADAQGVNPILTQNAVIDLGAFLAAAGKSCANDGDVVYLCVQGLDPSNGNARFAFASSAVTISTTIPPAPLITSVVPGAGAVKVTWEPGVATSSTEGDSHAYRLSAEMVASTATASDRTTHFSPMLTTTTATLGVLTPTVTYAVTATAYSKAGNASDPSSAVTATPHASAPGGGGSSGGCASGLAGPLSLAIVAGALALARRLRRRPR